MIGTIINWFIIIVVVAVLVMMGIAPFILSGRISEQEERDGL